MIQENKLTKYYNDCKNGDIPPKSKYGIFVWKGQLTGRLHFIGSIPAETSLRFCVWHRKSHSRLYI